MARWRLTQKHYLNVPGTVFEYKETTHYGRQIKKDFPTGLFLDPESPVDCNYNADGETRSFGSNQPGEIIVAWDDGTQKPRDIIFVGPPTLDMVPLDDAAKAASAEMAPGWGRAYISDMDEEGGYTNRLLNELTETLNSFNASAKPSTPAVEDERIKGLEAQVNAMLEMNKALITQLQPVKRI